MLNLVRAATIRDLKRVFSLSQHYTASFSQRNLSRGFFTKGLTMRQLKSFVRDPKKVLFICAPKGAKKIHGFVTGYLGKRAVELSKINLTNPHFKEILVSGRYAWIERVGKWETAPPISVGLVYRKFYEYVKGKGFEYVLGKISISPPNVPSLRYHRDFAQIGYFVDSKTNVTWGIFAKKL